MWPAHPTWALHMMEMILVEFAPWRTSVPGILSCQQMLRSFWRQLTCMRFSTFLCHLSTFCSLTAGLWELLLYKLGVWWLGWFLSSPRLSSLRTMNELLAVEILLLVWASMLAAWVSEWVSECPTQRLEVFNGLEALSFHCYAWVLVWVVRGRM